MSKENIKTMLMSMRGRTIKVPKRTGPRPGDIDNAAGKVELPILEADGDMNNRWFLSTHWALEAGTMYGEKKMLEVIQRVFHRFTRKRKIVTGFTFRNETDAQGNRIVNPHVYQTMVAAPNNNELFKVPNNSDDGGVAFFVADVDLDTYAHQQHMQDAAYSEDITESTAFTTVAEWYANRWSDQDTLDYPRALLENSKRKRRDMEARAVLNEDNRLSRKRRRR